MRTLFLDCGQGLSLGLLLSALYDLQPLEPAAAGVQQRQANGITGLWVEPAPRLPVSPRVQAQIAALPGRWEESSLGLARAVLAQLEYIAPERVVCSPICLGYGAGIPRGETLEFLKGVPCFGGEEPGEHCDGPGAALMGTIAPEFGHMPEMTLLATGAGVEGGRCLRAYLGESVEEIAELCCNLDDCTGEEIGYACQLLLEEGALDVFTTPIQMKKFRPGVLVTVLARMADAPRLTELLLRHTTTLGVRQKRCTRTTLPRRELTRQTAYGNLRVKQSGAGDLIREKPEYEDLAAIARETGLPLSAVRRKVEEER